MSFAGIHKGMRFRGNKRSRILIGLSVMAVYSCLALTVSAEDGYRLWLRYDPLPAQSIAGYAPRVTSIVVSGNSSTLDAIRSELVNGCSGLLGRSIPTETDITRSGTVVIGTPRSSAIIAGLHWEGQLAQLGPEGFLIRSVKLGKHSVCDRFHR